MKEYNRRWNTTIVNPGFTLGEYLKSRMTVPYSELAMHMRVAGKVIESYRIEGFTALVWLKDEIKPVSGLVSELLPFALRKD